jgi:hypothetical protein
MKVDRVARAGHDCGRHGGLRFGRRPEAPKFDRSNRERLGIAPHIIAIGMSFDVEVASALYGLAQRV